MNVKKNSKIITINHAANTEIESPLKTDFKAEWPRNDPVDIVDVKKFQTKP